MEKALYALAISQAIIVGFIIKGVVSQIISDRRDRANGVSKAWRRLQFCNECKLTTKHYLGKPEGNFAMTDSWTCSACWEKQGGAKMFDLEIV